MFNILTDSLSLAELEEALGTTETVFPVAGDPAWKETAAKPAVRTWLRQIRETARAERDAPMPELTDELYGDFHKTGRGLPFSMPYFERRRRLARAAVCALFAFEENGGGAANPWMASLADKLAAIVGEEAWAIPAHVHEPSGKDSLAIDIFAAETANLAGEVLNLFASDLPDDLVAATRRRLRHGIFENFLDRHDTFRWIHGSHNWNAVCHHGIVGAALGAGEEPRLLAQLVRRAAENLPFFLKGFPVDGGCTEGPGYWEYGFGSFSILNDQLETATAGRLSLFENDDHIHAIARYGPAVSLSRGRLVNFADCRPRGMLRPFVLQYLGERLGDELCREQGRENYLEQSRIPLDLGAQRCDLSYLLRLFRYCPRDLTDLPPPKDRTTFFPALGLMVVKATSPGGRRIEFAVKGGHNGEHHNHNDCGSYLLNIDGHPFAYEIGGSEYTRDYLRDRRYEFIATRTRGHSLPVINGYEQPPGREFAADIISAENKGTLSLELDLTRCYPPDAGCRSLIRIVTLNTNEGWLEIEDRFSLSRRESLECGLITEAKIVRDGEPRLVNGDRTVRLDLCGNLVVNRVETHDYRTGTGKPASVRRIALRPHSIEAKTRTRYRLSLLDP